MLGKKKIQLDNGTELDLSKVTYTDLEAMIKDIGELTVDVDGDAQVRIRCEWPPRADPRVVQPPRRRAPAHDPFGIVVTEVGAGLVRAELEVKPSLMAPNGYLHAGSIVTLADTAAGYGCLANLPGEATGFTTIELKSNHLGTALEGMVDCLASAVHMGRTTHVWDAVVSARATGKAIAIFRCTQLILYPTSTR